MRSSTPSRPISHHFFHPHHTAAAAATIHFRLHQTFLFFQHSRAAFKSNKEQEFHFFSVLCYPPSLCSLLPFVRVHLSLSSLLMALVPAKCSRWSFFHSSARTWQVIKIIKLPKFVWVVLVELLCCWLLLMLSVYFRGWARGVVKLWKNCILLLMLILSDFKHFQSIILCNLPSTRTFLYILSLSRKTIESIFWKWKVGNFSSFSTSLQRYDNVRVVLALTLYFSFFLIARGKSEKEETISVLFFFHLSPFHR